MEVTFWCLSYINATYCLTAIILFLITKWYWKGHYWNKTLPPGPPSLPLLGSLPFMSGSNTGEIFGRLFKKYGDIFMLDFGLQRCVVLNRFNLVKEVYLKHADKCLNRPNKFVGAPSRKEYGIAFNMGKSWYEQKKFSLQCLRDLGFGKMTTEEIILEELEIVSSEIAAMGDQPFDPAPILSKATFNIIITFINGERFEHDNQIFIRLYEHVDKTMKLLDKNTLINCFPMLRHVPIISRVFHEQDKSWLELAKLAQKLINEKKEKLSDSNEPSSFIDAYFVKMKQQKSNDENYFTEDDLKWSVADMIVGGSDSSSATLTWCFAFILNHAEVKKKVLLEIQNAIGKRRPGLQDRRSLPYCDAVLHEIMRVSKFVTAPLPRVTTDDIVVNGYLIPKGTTVMQNFEAIHNHPLDFDNPKEFNPDRFLDGNGHFKNVPEFNIFSNGKRNCVGEGLAKAEIFLFFVLLMQRFDIKPAEGEAPPRLDNVTYGLANHPKVFQVVASAN